MKLMLHCNDINTPTKPYFLFYLQLDFFDQFSVKKLKSANIMIEFFKKRFDVCPDREAARQKPRSKTYGAISPFVRKLLTQSLH